MGKQSSVGNLPEGQVAPGSPCCSRGFPKGQHQRGSLNLSHSVCPELPIHPGAVSKSLPALGKLQILKILLWIILKEASAPSALGLLVLKVYALWGEGVAVGKETAPTTLQGPSASVQPLWVSVYSAGKWVWFLLGVVMRGPRPSIPTGAWGWANAQGSERTSLPWLKLPL